MPAVTCTRYAAPAADRPGTGTLQSPYRSVQALVDGLAPGQTGCLLPGVYRENISIRRGGSPSSPLTLASVSGGRAVLLGLLSIAHGADYVTIRNLALNSSGAGSLPSPQVNDDHATFYEVDVTNEHAGGICFDLGGAAGTYGVATHTVIANSRIHDCGHIPRDHLEHGIYLAHSRGAIIVDNYIYDNADWGLHLYPDAQDSNIQYNTLEGNGDGIIIAGTDDLASSGNMISHNILSNAVDTSHLGEAGNIYGYELASFWGGQQVGRANVVAHNCLWGGIAPGLQTANGGFTTDDNRVADPSYVSRSDKDFRLRDDSPCAGDGPREG